MLLRKINLLFVSLIALSLSACATAPVPVVQTEYQKVYVNVPAPCPEKAVGDDLIKTRPFPLRFQEKPSDASVRSAQSQAQLGKYEAQGGWADKVVAALTRCGTQ